MEDNEIVLEWLEVAHNDHVSAKILLTKVFPPQIETASFHSQQIVEKTLKAFLAFHKVLPPKTHDLVELCALCTDINESFSNFKSQCAILTKYATNTRYPGKTQITNEEAQSAFVNAEQIYFAVKKIINLKIKI